MKPKRRSVDTGLICVLIISASLRFFRIGLNSYWIDELVSVHFASYPRWEAIFWDNNPFLYHLLLKFWIFFFGTGEAATRSMSALLSIATTGVLYVLGRRLGGKRAAWTCGLLHAFSVLSITYAQESRMYAILEFFSAVTLSQCAGALFEKKSAKSFILTAPLLSLTSYLAVVPLGMESVTLFFSGGKKKKAPLWALVAFALGIAAIVASYLYFFRWNQLQWQKLKFSAEPESHWPGLILWDLANRSRFASLGLAVTLILFFAAAFRRSKYLKPAVLGFLFTILPLAGFWILSEINHRSVFLPRYFIYLVPFAVLWAGMTIAGALEDKKLYRLPAVAALTLITAGSVEGLPSVYTIHKSPWREAAEYVAEFPHSHGLTTRTAAIETPYFQNHGITVEKWDPETQKIDYVIAEGKSNGNLWMIENYFGGMQYFDRLKAKLEQQGFQTVITPVTRGRGEPVLLMRIFSKP